MRLRPASNNAPLQAGIYCRLSLAKFGDSANVEDQERICRELATGRGWEVARAYTDNSRSAWQRNRKRPDWDAMLADVDAGKLQAIVIYHGDRLVRQPFDLETLLNLSYGKGILLASPTGTRDLSNEDDLFILRIEVAAACRESAGTSRRVKRDIARSGTRGVVNSGGRGGRLFGFGTDGVTQEPREIAIVREVYTRVLAGEGIRTVAADLSRRGITTTAGRPVHPMAVRRMVGNPRYAGLMPDGTTRGAWEPAVQRADWESANAVLAMHRTDIAPGHNARRYLLSGIAGCGLCGSGLQILSGTGRQVTAYRCIQDGCRKVYRSQELLDAYVARRVVNKLNNPANPAARRMAAAGLAVQFEALRQQRAEAEAAAADPAQRHLPVLLARIDSIDERLRELRQLAEGDVRDRLLDKHAGITPEEFAAEPLATRRALVSACFQVSVLPASKRGPGFRTEDVVLAPH
jgi:DNA invertase Pin-like site-specific DNA recombinase